MGYFPLAVRQTGLLPSPCSNKLPLSLITSTWRLFSTAADDFKLHTTRGDTKKTNLCNAVNEAIALSMEADDRTLCFGEDVSFGGVFRCTVDLRERFGQERVFNTPLCEQGIIGFGIGVASRGYKAVAEIQFADYVFPALDQLINEAAKMRYRSGGLYDSGGLTVRMPCGSVGHGGHYHSQSPEAFFTHAHGLKVVMPSGPMDGKGLLMAAIQDPNPVIFMEPKFMYRNVVEDIPKAAYTIPLGVAGLRRLGTDITLVGWGPTVETLLTASNLVSKTDGINPEVIDLRTLMPWDAKAVEESVRKTGRLIVCHEAPITSGFGAEIVATITDRCFFHLESAPTRICGYDIPFPLAFEQMYLPSTGRIVDAIRLSCLDGR